MWAPRRTQFFQESYFNASLLRQLSDTQRHLHTSILFAGGKLHMEPNNHRRIWEWWNKFQLWIPVNKPLKEAFWRDVNAQPCSGNKVKSHFQIQVWYMFLISALRRKRLVDFYEFKGKELQARKGNIEKPHLSHTKRYHRPRLFKHRDNLLEISQLNKGNQGSHQCLLTLCFGLSLKWIP